MTYELHTELVWKLVDVKVTLPDNAIEADNFLSKNEILVKYAIVIIDKCKFM